ncbi:MAG: hypothetical protein ACK521_11870, partial [bacterium]
NRKALGDHKHAKGQIKQTESVQSIHLFNNSKIIETETSAVQSNRTIQRLHESQEFSLNT